MYMKEGKLIEKEMKKIIIILLILKIIISSQYNFFSINYSII